MDPRTDSPLGPYRPIRLLGRGGMGAVYEAEHVQLGVRRALKVFRPGGDAALRRRFLAEGRLLARLDHPRLVRVHDLGVDAETDRAWFAMDLVLDAEGRPRTLEDVRRAGEVSEADAAVWFDDLCGALAYVHGRGIAHRDVKLENALLDATGHVVLSDFGISRILDPGLRAAAGLSATATFAGGPGLLGPLMGTLGYLAPELKTGGAASSASDRYALGVLMFRLLTGIWYEPGTDVLALLEPFEYDWEAVLVPLLAEDPAARGLPSGPPVPKAPPPRRRLRAGLLLAGGTLLAVAAGAGAWRLLRPARTAPGDTFESLFAAPTDFGPWEEAAR